MASTGNAIRRAVSSAGEKVSELAWTVGRDPREEKRLRRRWGLLEATLGALFGLAARRLSYRLWGVLTGEEPPIGRAAHGTPPKAGESERPAETRVRVEEPLRDRPVEARSGESEESESTLITPRSPLPDRAAAGE